VVDAWNSGACKDATAVGDILVMSKFTFSSSPRMVVKALAMTWTSGLISAGAAAAAWVIAVRPSPVAARSWAGLDPVFRLAKRSL
jgi:hypothetical protein